MEAKPDRSDPEGVFDREVALARLEGDTPLLEEVAGMFLEQAPEMLLQLRQSASTGDLAAVEFTAHALKGMGSSLAAGAFTAEALRMELAARERKAPVVMQALPDIERELDRLLAGLAAFTKA
jgi:HPt (histidine-containing phosphotransfer) domain-containing protein